MPVRKDLVELVKKLESQKKGIWKRAAQLLALPRRRRVEVNLSKIEKYASDGKVILVPGKVLGAGKLTKKVKIAAFSFSESAKRMVKESGSEIMSIEELLKVDPEGKSVMILI